MKTSNFYKFIACIVFIFICGDICLFLINAQNTLANIGGFILLATVFLIVVKTRAFTSITIKKNKNEKDI